MNAPEIFDSTRMHSFYKDLSDFRLLPAGSATTGIPRRNEPTELTVGTSGIVGASTAYEDITNRYDPSLTLQKIRESLIAGKKLLIKDLRFGANNSPRTRDADQLIAYSL